MREIEYKIKHKEEDCKKCSYEGICSSPLCETEKVEQVPENWEDLKELCEQKNAEILCNTIYICGLSFKEKGKIFDNEGNEIAENRTYAQIWQIIKNLVEEK